MKYRSFLLILVAAICGVVGSVVFQPSHGQTNASSGNPLDKLRSLIDSRVDDLGTSNLNSASVSAIHKLGKDFFAQLHVSDQQKTELLFSELNKELLDAEKRELFIKILLSEISKQKHAPKQFAGCSRYLERYNLGGIDSSIVACVTMTEMHGGQVFSDREWQQILFSYLRAQEGLRLTIADQVLTAAEHEHWNPSGGAVLPKWTSEEQQQIADAILGAQSRILARRFLQEKMSNAAKPDDGNAR